MTQWEVQGQKQVLVAEFSLTVSSVLSALLPPHFSWRLCAQAGAPTLPLHRGDNGASPGGADPEDLGQED